MRYKKYGHPVFVLLIASILLASCTDDWENHYNTKAVGKSDLSLYEYVKSQNDLGIFTRMLQITGYDTILSKSQTYTIWAPTDLALQGVNLQDTGLVLNLVTNHIARFSYSVLNANNITISMLNNKRLVFAKSGDTYTFDGKALLRCDMATFNGIVHVLGEYVPYRMSHWQYIMNATGIDSLRAYFNSLSVRELDVEKSYKDEVFVDSIFKITNQVLTILGDLNLEDSIYTMVLPDNNAWIEAYGRTMSFYNTLAIDGGVKSQISNTKWTMVRDLVFRGKLTMPITNEILTSTYGNKFLDPESIFEGTQRIDLSNGYAYKTSLLKYKAIESWFKEIRIEAEDTQNGGRIAANYTVSTVSGLGTGFDISDNDYIAAVPKTSSAISQLSLKFPIPNTLSAKYNIYVVFVPTYAIDKTDKRPYKLNYFLSYINSAGKQITDSKLTVANNITDSTKMTKVLVAENFQFPYCNIVSSPGLIGNVTSTVQLKIVNATGTSATETANYNRTIRVDCVILEPVQ